MFIRLCLFVICAVVGLLGFKVMIDTEKNTEAVRILGLVIQLAALIGGMFSMFFDNDLSDSQSEDDL